MIRIVSRFWLLVVAALAFGCERSELLGRVGASVGTGGTSGDAGNGEGGGAPDPVGPLVDPARDTDPTFTADLRELYFMTTRITTSKDIWKSVRNDPADEWGAPVSVPELSSGYQEENPRVSADGLRLWYYTDRDRDLGTIWEITRPTLADPWGPLTPVPGLSVGPNSSNVSAGMNDGATLAVLSARQVGSAGYDLYSFTRASTSESFGAPTALSEVNSASDDFDPWLSPNGLALAFASNRLGDFDIYLARRTSTEVPFEGPVRLDLNSPGIEESAPHLSPDLAYLMYSSDRGSSSEIYEATIFPDP